MVIGMVTTNGARKLIAWREEQGLERHEAAILLGIREHSMRRYESGGRPGLDAACKIEIGTHGAVDVLSWRVIVELPEPAREIL